ncbi:MAG: DUF1415 domain-containing protein [Ferruginibacter sp.]
MPGTDTATIIAQTKKWIVEVVVGCGFCPFAAKEIKRDSIHYEVLPETDRASVLRAMMLLLHQMDANPKIETALLILPEGYKSFDIYLQLLDIADTLLAKEKYEGIYQIASFHPGYLFAGSNENDAANYTNRSPYPMLHFLREESVSKAVDSYPEIDEVPIRNVRFANEKGRSYMEKLLAASMSLP